MPTQGEALPRTSTQTPFFIYSFEQEALFNVREGVPFEPLLEQLHCLLETAHACVLTQAANQPNNSELRGAAYLVEMCLALSNACIPALTQE